MNKYYSDPKNMEKQKDRMTEHYADPKNRGKHQNDMKERMSSNRSQGPIKSDDDNEISGAEEKLLSSMNVEKCKANCLKAIRNLSLIHI